MDRDPLRPHHREDHYRYPNQDKGQRWTVEPHYRAPFSSPHNAEQYPYCPPQHQRPRGFQPFETSRRSRYAYPLLRHWDYGETYGHYEHHYYNCSPYEHNYYRRQQQQQDSGQWAQQDVGRSDCFQERSNWQDYSGEHMEEHRSDQERIITQHFLSEQENKEDSSCHTCTLASSKHSGLSSSSSELSQYINAAEKCAPVTKPVHACEAGLGAPLKYAVPHAVASFGPTGQLVRITPGFSSQDSVSQLEIHSLEVILSESQEQMEMRKFPGPLNREHLHKKDSIEFASQKAATYRKDSRHDNSSTALLWNFLVLLCRQNGQIVGCDIAEMLMQGSHWQGKQDTAGSTLIDFSDGPPVEALPGRTEDMVTGRRSSWDTSKDALQRYSQLLLAGRKKEALEWAMSSDLWGHALFLASKMDSRSYATVLNRFTSQLAITDPLQTLFQVLSGRIPAAATCCGNDKWGDWKPHLAVLLSNETGDPAVQQKAIVTMGDTLASRGLVHAAHMCYLAAGVPFGLFTQKTDRLVLIGSNHRKSFQHFASNSAIQCTELYEYCQTLSGSFYSIPSFQVYKFVYATRLLDCGLSTQAFHYCEVVGKAILQQRSPSFVLMGELIKLAERLRHAEDHFSAAGASGAQQDSSWLTELRKRHNSFQMEAPDQPPADDLNNTNSSEAPWDDLKGGDCSSRIDVAAHFPQLEGNAASWGSEPAQGLRLISPVPLAVIYGPSEPRAACSQHYSYHNREGANVTAALPHCFLTAGTSSDTLMLSHGSAQPPGFSSPPPPPLSSSDMFPSCASAAAVNPSLETGDQQL